MRLTRLELQVSPESGANRNVRLFTFPHLRLTLLPLPLCPKVLHHRRRLPLILLLHFTPTLYRTWRGRRRVRDHLCHNLLPHHTTCVCFVQLALFSAIFYRDKLRIFIFWTAAYSCHIEPSRATVTFQGRIQRRYYTEICSNVVN